jgi:glycosyltransferase involved in cell wall biosynthesis
MRIAFWGETGWAIGRIGRAVQKYAGHPVDLYHWSVIADNNTLFFEKWHEYDLIITTTLFGDLDTGHSFSPDLYRRLLIVSHFPVLNHHQFREVLCVRPGASYAGVSVETCREMERHGMGPAKWMPFGVDTDEFPIRHVVTGPLRRIGITGNPHSNEYYTANKGLSDFAEICQRLGAEPVYIHSRTGTTDLYTGIDLFVCASRLEAGPLGIFEAAACGVPVLTRPVGNAQRIKGIAMFDTVDDAVTQIRRWNGHLRSLEDYAAAVTQEVRTNWSMEQLIRRQFA